MATTVAGEEPESAANSMQAKTPAIARPPGKCPTQAMEKRMIRRATPPVVMKDRGQNEEGDRQQREVPLERGEKGLRDEASELSERQQE